MNRFQMCLVAALCSFLVAWHWATPADENVRNDPAVRVAMDGYRGSHLACEWCGSSKRLEVHHVQPVWMSPGLAADTNNYCMLCRKCHLYVGHAGLFAGRAVTNLKEICSMHVVVERERVP